MCVENAFRSIDNELQRYLTFLCDICGYEARARDKQSLDAMVSHIADFARAEGFAVTRTPMKKCGDFLALDLNVGAQKGKRSLWSTACNPTFR